MNLIKLSWRNIWRNRRRTLITVASILFAVLFAVVMRAFQEGVYGRAIENTVRMMSGHIQIQNPQYWDDQIIDNVFPASDSFIQSVAELPEVEYALPRMQYFAFASSGEITREALVMGMNPELEEPIAQLQNKIRSGEMCQSTSQGVVLAEGLAHSLGLISYKDSIVESVVDGEKLYDTVQQIVKHSDTLVLIGQGYHAVSANGKYYVEGIVKLPIPELNKRAVYMPLALAQQFYDTYGLLTSLNIQLLNADDQEKVIQKLSAKLNPKEHAVLPWQDLHKLLMQQIESDRGSSYITIALLYIIIGFGIFGTIIMMVTERQKEFGIMVAIGMQKTRLSLQLAVELFFMGIIGVFSGALASIPILWYYYINPIKFTGELAETYESYGWEAVMPVSMHPSIFIEQAAIVFVLFALSCIYAIVQVFKLDAKTAIHK